jgi:hypothetical protein
MPPPTWLLGLLDRHEPAGACLIVNRQPKTARDFIGAAPCLPSLQQPAGRNENRARGFDLKHGGFDVAAAVLDDLPRDLFDRIGSLGHRFPLSQPRPHSRTTRKFAARQCKGAAKGPERDKLFSESLSHCSGFAKDDRVRRCLFATMLDRRLSGRLPHPLPAPAASSPARPPRGRRTRSSAAERRPRTPSRSPAGGPTG